MNSERRAADKKLFPLLKKEISQRRERETNVGHARQMALERRETDSIECGVISAVIRSLRGTSNDADRERRMEEGEKKPKSRFQTEDGV